MIYALSLTGPTASGKTSISLTLAKRLGCEIISCDSMQIYKYMNIGTAKATPSERSEVVHHMLDVALPDEDYSVEAYRAAALEAAEQIARRGATPLFVGGTGLYIDAIMRRPSPDVPQSSREFRDKLMAGISSEEDVQALWNRLLEIDAEAAHSIHKNNLRRVIRAIEIYEMTGKPKSYFDRLSRLENPDIRVGMITLDFHNRENLYSGVDRRVDEMLAAGLVDEVSALYHGGILKKNTTAAQAIGYKEIIKYLDGELSLDAAVQLIKLSTRRYAKRQLTWFRHEECARIYVDTDAGVMRHASEILEEACGTAERLIKENKVT